MTVTLTGSLVNLSVESPLQPAQTNTVMDLGPAICDLAGKQILVTAALIFVNSPFPHLPLTPRHHVTCCVALTCAGCYVPVRFGIPSSFGHFQTFGGTVTIGHNERQGAFMATTFSMAQCPTAQSGRSRFILRHDGGGPGSLQRQRMPNMGGHEH